MAKTRKMTVQAASRIYSATATKGDGTVGKDTFGARVMSAAMRQPRHLAAPDSGKGAADGSKQ